MKKLIFAISALAITTASASAADMAVKALPPPVVVDSWTGFYAGINGGGIWGRDRLTAAPADPGSTAFFAPCFAAGACPRDYGRGTGTSGEVGGQIGYNWQRGAAVFGFESDIQWTDVKSNASVAFPNTGTGFVPYTGTQSSKLEWFGTTRGRLGFLAAPNVLLYGTAGVAYGEVQRSWTGTFAATAQNIVGSNTDTRVGWVAGAGVEWKWQRNWIFGVEYLHMELDSNSFGATGAGSAGCTAVNCNFNVSSNGFKSDMVRARVSYEFGGPVVARY
jgi:outer membrane immunogenic protein